MAWPGCRGASSRPRRSARAGTPWRTPARVEGEATWCGRTRLTAAPRATLWCRSEAAVDDGDVQLTLMSDALGNGVGEVLKTPSPPLKRRPRTDPAYTRCLGVWGSWIQI